MQANTHEKNYVSNWQGDGNIPHAKDNCVVVNDSVNAYPANVFCGRGRECNYGYRERCGGCVVIDVPEIGNLNTSGGG
jgi:hypothetical protein